MKWFGKLIFLAIFVAGIMVWPARAGAQNTQDFVIRSFNADYYLDRNSAQTSTLHTVEVIKAEFPSFDQNHGILRAIPQSYQNHIVSLKIDSVTDENNTPLKYSTSTQNDNLVLKIGDAHTYVHNLKTYKITYDAKNVVSFLSNHQEFYWDVNGDQWQQHFYNIIGRVHIPAGLAASLQDRTACYAGANGYTDSSRCSISQPVAEGSGQVFTAQAANLGSGETLTLVTGFNAGTFKLGPEPAQAQKDQQKKAAAIIAGVLVVPLVTGGYLISRWRKYGRDPKGRGVIIPEYQPPKGLNVLTSDFIFIEALNNKAISAMVLELAIRKYITIYEHKEAKRLQRDTTSYSLKLNKDPSDLTDEEKAVVNMFFDKAVAGSEVKLNDLKNKLATDSTALKKQLGKNLLAAGYFKNDPNSASNMYYLAAIVGLLVGFYVVSTPVHALGVSIILAGLVCLVFARYMPARSQSGVDVHDYMLGLRDYIKLAEADRLKFLQSPQGAEKIKETGLDPNDPKYKVKLFESLLPYAMVFNLEKDWAKQFSDVYAAPPGWYNGNWSTFNAVYLASSIGGFNSASALTFTSASSGGSGFGGGGSSGGGGGGGGGGGW